MTHIQAFRRTEEELLSIVRALEEYSTHPIAKTIVEYTEAGRFLPQYRRQGLSDDKNIYTMEVA